MSFYSLREHKTEHYACISCSCLDFLLFFLLICWFLIFSRQLPSSVCFPSFCLSLPCSLVSVVALISTVFCLLLSFLLFIQHPAPIPLPYGQPSQTVLKTKFCRELKSWADWSERRSTKGSAHAENQSVHRGALCSASLNPQQKKFSWRQEAEPEVWSTQNEGRMKKHLQF